MMEELQKLIAIESDENVDIDSLTLTPAEESEILLNVLKDECKDEAEFQALIQETAMEMELFGVIDSADRAYAAIGSYSVGEDSAMEANLVKYKVTRQDKLDKATSQTCIKLAKAANDQNYTKYRFHKTKMLEYRSKIYQKYASRAKSEAKKMMANAQKRSVQMSSASGKDISKKIDAVVDKTRSDKAFGNDIKK